MKEELAEKLEVSRQAVAKWEHYQKTIKTIINISNGSGEQPDSDVAMNVIMMWIILAILSAVFAALTSILAKMGIDGLRLKSRVEQQFMEQFSAFFK